MAKRRVRIEVVEDITGRFLVTTYADGEVVRLPIAHQEPKRLPRRPYRRLSVRRERQ
jgi:hypothetical protein